MTGIEYNLDLTDRGLVFIGTGEKVEGPAVAPVKKGSSLKSIAAKIVEGRPAISRQDFIRELTQQTDCSPFTAQNYWGLVKP